MGTHWVRAVKVVIRYDLAGSYRTYQPGDWFQVKNQELTTLAAQGKVETTSQLFRASFQPGQAGLLIRGAGGKAPADLRNYGIAGKRGDVPDMPWPLTALWRPDAMLLLPTLTIGLLRVEGEEAWPAWEMAAMLAVQGRLARDAGSEAERKRTMELVGDLRVPLYDTGLVWVRRTEQTAAVLATWRAELDAGASDAHAFLRAVYRNPVALCTLPAGWMGQWTPG